MKASPASAKIRILVAEDHILVRMGLVSAANKQPDIEVVAEVEDGRQVAGAFRAHQVDVVILDLRMPGMDGIEIIRTLRAEFGPVRILMLSSHGGGDAVARAIQAGASGYIVKGMPLKNLLEGIRAVHAGRRYLPLEIANRMEARMNAELGQ